jgi:diguanylate cyclase (GGDEF)-like protein/putative nucleotidyltransferase with HDIG domain
VSQDAIAVIIAIFLLAVYFLYQRPHLREERAWSETGLLRYSNLHLFTTTLSEIGNPAQMAEQMLDRTLQALVAGEGCLLLRTPSPGELNCTSSRGLSDRAIERLSTDPLHGYLASSATRWGRQMVFPDLSQAASIAECRGDPLFLELQNLLLAEGLKTLVVAGLRVKERSYGALLIGSRKPRVFQPGELRLLLAISHQISVTLENRFLHQEAERHHESLQTLHHVGAALSATFDPDVQLQILRAELKELLGATNFSLTYQDPATGGLETVLSFESNLEEEEVEDKGLLQYVLENRTSLWIAYNMLGRSRLLGIPSVDARIRTWCGVPLRFSDGSIGVLAVADFEREYAVTEEQFKFLEILAGGVAAAVENARLFQREQRRARHLALLNELGRSAAAVLNPQELLSSICRQIRSNFGYHLVRIEILDRARDQLVIEAEDGYGSEVLGRRARVGKGLAGLAAERGEAVVSNRADRDARYVALAPGVLSAMSIPLKFRGVTLGVLSIGSQRADDFSAQDAVTLGMLADQLAIALHNARAYQEAQEQAITDGLTGLKTHRFFREAIEAEWRRAARSGKPFAVIMLDLDTFKAVNDRRGHLEGDKVLAAVARLIEARSRQSSVAARYGGDEFAILMPETEADQAELLAERLRTGLLSDPYLTRYGVTASIGIASFPAHGATPDEILSFADCGMYVAKHGKGNRVCLASSAPPSAHVEAYLGVAVQRLISTGPEVFEHYLQSIRKATESASPESISLLDTVAALAFVIDAKDPYTRGHSHSVSRLATRIAGLLGLPELEVEEIRLAAILHDIGKIGIPENVLNKPARLTRQEYEIMKTHADLGWRILEPLKAKAIERIRQMVRHHHERVDGRGYPDGLRGDEIPLGARILSLADAYDTIVSVRAYQEARSIEEARVELRRGRGGHFDADLVDAFLESQAALAEPGGPGHDDPPSSLDTPRLI